jgi:phosphatidate phosphatase APP1
MPDWKPALQAWFARADALSDRTRGRWRRLRPSRRRQVIVPYIGFGTRQCITLTGRVLRDDGLRPATATDSGWRNAARFYRQMASDEVPRARVRAIFQGRSFEAVSDDEGYFECRIEAEPVLAEPGWHAVPLTLADAPGGAEPVGTTAQVLVPPDTAQFGVISDIDDTVVWTHATDRLRMLWMLLRSNAHTRKPFEGVTAFYRALTEGASGREGNPIFYVSSSPWNLYAPLIEYLDLQGIPLGPLLLKDFGDHTLFSSSDHASHKRASIERILATYPALPFVLIGDSGEQDPEIYSAVVHAHPDRVRVIYIRNVNPDPSRVAAIGRLVEEVRSSGAQLVLAADSVSAAAHAAGEGLIRALTLNAVSNDSEADRQAPMPAAPPDEDTAGER